VVIGRAALLAALSLLAAAVPAQATLLVRSDGEGLTVLDKNGLDDNVFVFGANGPRFVVLNANFNEIFPFDRQTGCNTTGDSRRVGCNRDRPKMNIGLFGGNDDLDMNGDGPEPGPAAGDASVNAGSGNDEVVGHAGRDQISGLSGADRVFGGPGNDRLEGGDGADSLFGDGGADVLEGGENGDSLRAKESTTAVADSVNCGSGSDFVEGDLQDTIAANCESRDISPVGETPLVRLPRGRLTVRRSRQVPVRLRCPRGVGSLGCEGRLSLRLDLRGARRVRKRYEIGAGRSRTVTVRLSRGSVRALRRRQRSGRRTRAIVASVERGRKGRKTTVRNPRARLSRR
jgi:hypothetical protein